MGCGPHDEAARSPLPDPGGAPAGTRAARRDAYWLRGSIPMRTNFVRKGLHVRSQSTKTGPFFSSGPIPNADTSQALYLRFDPRTHKSERKLSFPNFTVGKSRHFLFATHMCAKAISSALSSSMKLD